MKTSEIFKQCLKHLWNGRSPRNDKYFGGQYICHTIRMAANKIDGLYLDYTFINDHKYYKGVPELAPYCKALAIVQKRVGHKDCLEDWLRKNHGIAVHEYPYTQMQKYRKRWLESLIKEYQAIGD